MNFKNKTTLYVVGILITVLTFIPPMPRILQYILCLVPILFFGADLTLQYMSEFFKGKYINRFLCGVIAILGLILTGKLAYASMTAIFLSAANYYFDMAVKKAYDRINSASDINAPYARAVMDTGTARVSVNSVAPGQTLSLIEGDIVPCDSVVASGELLVDYTNVFGSGAVKTLKAGAFCFSGGIVQSGKAIVTVQKAAKDSLVATVNGATKRSHAPSQMQKKIKTCAKLFEGAMILLAVLVFVILILVTKDFSSSLNMASVILIASASVGMSDVLTLLCHNTVISARRRGVIFANMAAIEKCSKVQTVTLNEAVSEDVLTKIEETGAIPARGGNSELDAVLYRDRARLEGDKNPTFKLALGFSSKKADAFSLEAKPERIAGALRTARNYRGALMQNAIILLVEKLALLALLFLLNITPAAAVVIEFAAWMLCLLNASK